MEEPRGQHARTVPRPIEWNDRRDRRIGGGPDLGSNGRNGSSPFTIGLGTLKRPVRIGAITECTSNTIAIGKTSRPRPGLGRVGLRDKRNGPSTAPKNTIPKIG